MAILTLPFTFTNGTVSDATQVNSNFNAVVAQVNNINSANIGALGTYASQIIPTSAAQATFGGTLGYTFLAPAVGVTPLTVSGVTSQSADIFDVTLTSGGTKAFAINSTGGALFSNQVSAGTLIMPSGVALGGAAAVWIGNDSAGTNGLEFNVPTNSTNGFRFLVNNGTAIPFQIAQTGNTLSTGYFVAGSATAGTPGAGDLWASRSTSTGVIQFGGSVSNGIMDWNVNTAGGISFTKSAGGFSQVFGTSFTNSSDGRLKKNVVPITQALHTLAQLKPSSYNWIDDDQADLGFIAQDMQAVLPQIVRSTKDGTLGINYTGITTLTAAALIELAAVVKAYIAAHP